MTITPLDATSGATGTQTSSPTSSSTAAAANQDQNMFMQLLVAQLENQDPTEPMDSTTFVTQLAQFQQLQQATASGEDISAIRQDLDQLVAGQTSSS